MSVAAILAGTIVLVLVILKIARRMAGRPPQLASMSENWLAEERNARS